jgi:signal transduction histidine kinase/2-polyprenyl-3-methyl-5-hydroxy-6-metoxy-1,4-benzoquinol methylase
MRLPAEIEEKILCELGIPEINDNQCIDQRKIETLRQQMVSLSSNFARASYTETKYCDAYFAYNFSQNFMKMLIIIDKLHNLYGIPLSKDTLKILDLGCGDGAGMFGIFWALKKLTAESKFCLTGVDLSRNLLNRCEKIGNWFEKNNSDLDIELVRETISSFISRSRNEYDFIVLTNVLNEIFPSESIPASFVKSLYNRLTTNGLIIIIEPALRKLTRRLMQLHDDCIIDGSCYTLLPCLHNKPCPGLTRTNEWCHQSIKWIPPDYLKILNQKLFRKIEYLKFSYLILGNKYHNFIDEHRYLVISRLAKEKGRKRCLLCSEYGIVELIRLNRDVESLNQEFDNVCMGDIIQIENLNKLNEELEQSNTTINQNNIELKELNATKDKLFSIIAHDLRNPLQALITNSEILINFYDKLEPEIIRKKNYQILESSKLLISLLENLLTWSRTQLGRVQFHPDHINLKDLLSVTSKLVQPIAEQKSIKINNNLSENCEVFADANMVNTVFQNLITNAIKFSNLNSEISINCEDYDGNYLHITVEDNGTGISAEDIQKLLRQDQFHSTRGTMNEQGTGLGLILCKDFIEKNSGKIWIESELNKGTKVHFTLPKKKVLH